MSSRLCRSGRDETAAKVFEAIRKVIEECESISERDVAEFRRLEANFSKADPSNEVASQAFVMAAKTISARIGIPVRS